MNENKLIACFLRSREAYEKVSVYLLDKYMFSPFGSKVVEEIKSFYDEDPAAQHVDLDLIKQRLISASPKKDFLIEEYFSAVPSDVSVSNVLKLYEDVYKDSLRNELILCLNNKDDDKANELIEQLQSFSVEESDEGIYNATPIKELNVHFTGHNLIPIYPTALNSILGGGVPRQSQICIMARPDVGKSTVAINMAVGAAEKGFKVLYVGNEDPAPKMVMRILSRFLRKPEHEFRSLPDTDAIALERGYGNVFFKEMHPGNYSELRTWIEKLNPDVVVIDQIRNMNFKPDSMTINLEQAVIATRNLAKEFNLVMVVITQAGDSATNKVVLDMNDVEWSNTGVAAQMDLMIGVGQNPMLKEQGIVILSFPKNKLCAPLKPMSANIDYTLNRITVSQ